MTHPLARCPYRLGHITTGPPGDMGSQADLRETLQAPDYPMESPAGQGTDGGTLSWGPVAHTRFASSLLGVIRAGVFRLTRPCREHEPFSLCFAHGVRFRPSFCIATCA